MPRHKDNRTFAERVLAACFRMLDSVGGIGRMIVSPIEFVIMKIGGAIFHGIDRLTSARIGKDSQIDGSRRDYKRRKNRATSYVEKLRLAGRLFTAPIEIAFSRTARLLVRLITVTETRDSFAYKFLYALGAPLRWLIFIAHRSFSSINFDPVLKPFFKIFGKLGYLLTLPFFVCLGFVLVFLSTRSKRLLFYAIPLLILLGIFSFVVINVRTQQQSKITQRYRKAIESAIEQQDFATAGLYREKLKQLGASVEQFELKSADTLLKNGEVDQAFELVGRLAPSDKLGVPVAHLWLAVHLLGQAPFDQAKLSIPNKERCELAIKHLDLLEEAKFNSIELSMLRSLALSILGSVEDAKEILAIHRDEHLPSAMLRFQLNLQTSDGRNAQEDAKVLSRLMASSLESQATADSKSMQLWFLAEMMLQRNDEAESVASKWLQRFPEDIAARNAVLALRLARFDRRLATASTATYPELANYFFETYRLTLGVSPDPFKQRIHQLFLAAKEGDRVAREMFALLQAGELDSNLAHVFGTIAASTQSYQVARKYLEQSVELNPDHQAAWNNLAYVIDHGYPSEIDAALSAANKAIELNPTDLHARDTRASIFMRLQRYEEAEADVLEMVKIDSKFASIKRLESQIRSGRQAAKKP